MLSRKRVTKLNPSRSRRTQRHASAVPRGAAPCLGPPLGPVYVLRKHGRVAANACMTTSDQRRRQSSSTSPELRRQSALSNDAARRNSLVALPATRRASAIERRSSSPRGDSVSRERPSSSHAASSGLRHSSRRAFRLSAQSRKYMLIERQRHSKSHESFAVQVRLNGVPACRRRATTPASRPHVLSTVGPPRGSPNADVAGWVARRCERSAAS